jgi:hypothetical protein
MLLLPDATVFFCENRPAQTIKLAVRYKRPNAADNRRAQEIDDNKTAVVRVRLIRLLDRFIAPA